ncbi:hypothetical protein IW262DRAFT_1301467 [Armillaria fumosa]|nr:hypothetical protein IW262DRAFT_1301467 [Armillaria fumosa]
MDKYWLDFCCEKFPTVFHPYIMDTWGGPSLPHHFSLCIFDKRRLGACPPSCMAWKTEQAVPQVQNHLAISVPSVDNVSAKSERDEYQTWYKVVDNLDSRARTPLVVVHGSPAKAAVVLNYRSLHRQTDQLSRARPHPRQRGLAVGMAHMEAYGNALKAFHKKRGYLVDSCSEELLYSMDQSLSLSADISVAVGIFTEELLT